MIENNYSSLFCFTEANIIDSPAKHTDKIPDIWKDIHKNNMLRREYGKLHWSNWYSSCFGGTVLVAIVLQIVITYQIPAPRGAFFHDGILLICKLPTQQRVLVAGDLNLAHVVWGC